MLFARRIQRSAPALVLLLLAQLSGSCGGEPGRVAPPQAPDQVAGVLVARVELSSTHSVEFWEFADGTIQMRESGELEDLEQPLDYEALAPLSPVERFTALAGPAVPVPAALAEAASRSLRRAALESLGSPPLAPPAPAQELQGAPKGQAEALDARGEPGPGPLVHPLWDWSADAQWWQSNFCGTSSVDHVWCPTNVGWADAGSVWAMYYETSCLAASFDQSASHTLKQWDGTKWVLLASRTLSPRQWQKWWMETSNWYTSRCESLNTGGDSRVHFAHRVRWATPSISALSDHPFDREYGNDLSDDIQGVTHDSSNWYACNAEYTAFGSIYSHIWKTPVGTDLVYTPSPYYSNPWQGTYNHFGDISYGAGYIFVALESGGGNGHYGAVGVFNTSLQYYGWQIFPWAGESDQDTSAPWVAYNPKDGYLYSSKFNHGYINKYSWSLSYDNGWKVNLSFVGRIQLRDKYGNATSLTSLQGAEFSNTGKLYLSSDSAGGIYVVDVYNGRIQTFIKVQIDHSSGEELEGITLWNLDNGAAPNIAGQIHIQLLDNDTTSTDDLYFKHFRASEPSKL